MRRRLVIILALIGAVAVAGFAVPLVQVSAEARTRAFVQQRDSDVQRLAVLADEYVRTGDPGAIESAINAYHSVYDDGVLVVSTRGVPDLGEGISASDSAVREAITRGLRNQGGADIGLLRPWGPTSALFVQPVGTGAQVNGVVVIEAATAAARNDIRNAWTLVAIGTVIALGAFGLLALALSRWLLRPLSNLSSAMTDLAGQLPSVPGDDPPDTHPPVSGSSGPPEIRELSTTFDTLVGTVLRSVSSQRRLVADASHQLRNPLAALQFRLDVLEPDIPASAREDYSLISGEAQRLHQILDGLLTLASAETPRSLSSPEPQTCSVSSVVADRLDFWSVPAAERGATLSLDDTLTDPQRQVAMGESALSQILDVLVDNATRHAGEHPEVHVTVREEASMIEIDVADNGPGVSDEDLPRLTDRFFTRDQTSGTGLGLAIVDVIVRGVGGELSFGRSDLGGLMVSVRIAGREVPA